MEILIAYIIIFAIFGYVVFKCCATICAAINGLREPINTLNETLDKIYYVVGGREEIVRSRAELKQRVIKMFIKQGNSQKQAESSVNGLFDDIEYDLKRHHGFSSKFIGIEKWVDEQEIEQMNKEKYGHLLNKAREYLNGKTTLPAYDRGLEETVGTDTEGRYWLIEKLIQEGRLKEVKEHKGEEMRLKHYEVLAVKNQS